MQRPLATVVIGGLISATLLTLLVLPVLYDMWCRWHGKRAAVAVLLFACFFADPTTAAAQELSLQQAVQQALMHHPSMAISQLQLEQQNATLGKALALEPTQVQYSRGQLNTEVQDYQWQLQQRFRFPTAYWQQLQLYRSEVDRAELQHLFDRIQLEAAVRMAWWEWRYQQSRSELYRSLDALAERFVRSAEKRFRSGQISGLERSRARSDLEKWRLMAQGVESELEIARLDLMQWIAADSLNYQRSQNGSGPAFAGCIIHQAAVAQGNAPNLLSVLSPESVGLSARPDDGCAGKSGKSDQAAGHSDGSLCAAFFLGAAFRCGCGTRARIAASPDRGGETTHCIRKSSCGANWNG